MFVAMSRFRVVEGVSASVREAFQNRPGITKIDFLELITT
jgi:hypothetical protein